MLMCTLAVPARAHSSGPLQPEFICLQAQSEGVFSAERISRDTPGQPCLDTAPDLVGPMDACAASGAALRTRLALAPGKATLSLARKILALQSLVGAIAELAGQLRQRPDADEPPATFAWLDPIHASEFLRDLDPLMPTQK